MSYHTSNANHAIPFLSTASRPHRPRSSWLSPIAVALVLALSAQLGHSFPYDERYLEYNINQNPLAQNPLEYSGIWENHTYHPSPESWRFPFYTLFLDRFANGDPTNDNANGTVFEQDIMSTQLRFGGDVQGLIDSLDYIQGMGIKCLYIAGLPFLNQPWSADAYSPLDHTILDAHFGNIAAWRDGIAEIHRRGMYVLLDNTISTMGDLLGFEGYLNESTPFKEDEYPVVWKGEQRYHDFHVGTSYNETCAIPRLWDITGYPVQQKVLDSFSGCYDSDFDQFGDTDAFGEYPDYRRQMTKFSSVQDRLREWVPSVRERLAHFTCLSIAMLDFDGLRYDKATQVTLDALGNYSAQIRECARRVGKHNFFLPGEITGGNTFGALYMGRGKQPDMYLSNLTQAAALDNVTAARDGVQFVREEGQAALDGAAFHYSTYRFLRRFLGHSTNLATDWDLPPNWVYAWNRMLMTTDFLNAETNKLDPRHMYGTTNQDVFRWPAIQQGMERMLLGQFITTLHLPGIPLVVWGEEQQFSLLDSTANNYIYGRQAMTASPAWQAHGCYAMGTTRYDDMPFENVREACHNDRESWDHRDPSHPIRNILKSMYHLREVFPVLNDGLYLQQLSNMTRVVHSPFNMSDIGTETGLFSVVRTVFSGVQDLGDVSPVWLVYHNDNETETRYTFDCSSTTGKALIAPFAAGTRVKNLLYPHDEILLKDSATRLGFDGSTQPNGCDDSMMLKPFEFRAYVPVSAFVPPPAMITKFQPGHDMHIDSATLEPPGQVRIELRTSIAMDCDGFTEAVEINSITADQSPSAAIVDVSSVVCSVVADLETPPYIGAIGSAWSWSANLVHVKDGVHEIVVRNATTADKGSFTNAVDRFLIRVGDRSNPLVFPRSGNYSDTLLRLASADDSAQLTLTHSAPGASKWRYSLTWGSTWSDWQVYDQSKPVPIARQPWTGTEAQTWQGEHVMVQYWSRLLSSSAFIQHGDLLPLSTTTRTQQRRRFPHLYANGPFNHWGFDAGVDNEVSLVDDGQWEYHFSAEWPAMMQLNVWGMNPSGRPDRSFVYGDIDGDFVLDRLPPSSLVESVINMTAAPDFPALAYRLRLDDGSLRYELIPVGSAWEQLALYILLWFGPLAGGVVSVILFKRSFYKVKFIETGLLEEPTTTGRWCRRVTNNMASGFMAEGTAKTLMVKRDLVCKSPLISISRPPSSMSGHTMVDDTSIRRRNVLIATLEYNIDDWDIRIKIGGLGVMADLMGRSLQHLDLVWVVPCIGGIEYPIDTPAEPMIVTILGEHFKVSVQYHKLNNITFVLLDAPIFRRQTKANPYPPRNDDLDSAIYYSAWNQCIALTTRRFDISLYHCNDFHGAAAMLYLLPRTIPTVLSLHNAEYQGHWHMGTPGESREVCRVFDLEQTIVDRYVRFGSVFNLLHAGVSYLRIHQRGFGVVGVSKDYGDRSFARYAIFWGLHGVGKLPNPDPTDTGTWDREAFTKDRSVTVDFEYEACRAGHKRQAQEWAGLDINPRADLFVFVGRWSLQKGVDLIADIFPSILERYPNTQLLCIGPVIDHYGKFASLKLSKMMDMYPGRVYAKPEFTVLPEFIFSGAEFALIPSRDEPFGLVAVEFGRKGALGVGARVGGLGQTPGWWYAIESTSASHLLAQFHRAIVMALETKKETRAVMRAWSISQRFPVAQWVEDLETLHSTAVEVHENNRAGGPASGLAMSGKLSQGLQMLKRFALGMQNKPDVTYNLLPRTPMAEGEYLPGSETVSGVTTPAISTDGDTDFRSLPLAQLKRSGLGLMSPLARPAGVLGLEEIVGSRTNFELQKVWPSFTDSTGDYYHAFSRMLDDGLKGNNSSTELCIQSYLVKAEKEWFSQYRSARLGAGPRLASSTGNTSNFTLNAMIKIRQSKWLSKYQLVSATSDEPEWTDEIAAEKCKYKLRQFEIAENYRPPVGLQRYLSLRIGDWPIYSILIALGQVISSNSYQISLLAGEIGQTPEKLYFIASIYFTATIFWYIMVRHLQAVYALSLPFFLYGTAFLVLGMSPFVSGIEGRNVRWWTQNAATAIYAAASASGAIAFACNFGDEHGAPVAVWAFRACLVKGLEQVYAICLWYWGSLISASMSAARGPAGSATASSLAASPYVLVVCLPAALLLWAVGAVLYLGLPEYYRESPGTIPVLWQSLTRRKTIAWFLVAVCVQNYFLSAPYGRSWTFLFRTDALDGTVPAWAFILLAVGFFVAVWTGMLLTVARAARSHPWLFPIFAIGLGAPRWAQELWGVSPIGLYLPWMPFGGAVGAALASRALWLWLGVLDALQTAGIGVILMLTLTRAHVLAAVVAAQLLGTLATVAARATAPNRIGPGPIFPDMTKGFVAGVLHEGWFWGVLASQLLLCVGFFKFFRKEQVNKP